MERMIDINCDMGESFGAYTIGYDEEVLRWITSANIACGFHAGDPSVMRKTVRGCMEHGVAVGAHPGLPDLIGFGRRSLSITAEEAYEMTLYQIGALYAFVRAEGGRLQHVKPHGALYHIAETNQGVAQAIVRAAARIDESILIYGISGGELVKEAERQGVGARHEAFADRRYRLDGSLAPRSEADSVLKDPERAVEQALSLALNGRAKTAAGEQVAVRADTICIHGDSPRAPEHARAIYRALTAAGLGLGASAAL